MKSQVKYVTQSFYLLLVIGIQVANAQTTHKKTTAHGTSAPAKENYIAHEIKKTGKGDNGIYYDTLASKIKPADPTNTAGKQYQDIKVTLDAGDVIIANLPGERERQSISLLSNSSGHLNAVKANVDTTRYYNIKLSYKATLAGTYLLRITSKVKVPKARDDWQYYYEKKTAYNVNAIISTPASGVINDSASICDQVNFLLRQRLTSYMQITGAIADTTMDVLDKKKIGFINHLSTFTFYKNSKAKIAVDPYYAYVTFDQSLFYGSKSDALQAWRYFIENFKTCLGAEWAGEVDSSDPHWYKFKREGYGNIGIILYPEYNYVEILM